MTRRPFVPVPTALQHDDQLSRGARDLWILLDDLCRAAVAIEATGPYLTTALRCSPASLRRWRVELVEAGWLLHHAPDGGRGATSRWEPLQRARRVTAQPVDNFVLEGETRSLVSGSDLGNPLMDERVSHGPYKDPAREEEEARSRHRPRWCGCCDVTSRHREAPDGRPYRCPECHPALAPLF